METRKSKLGVTENKRLITILISIALLLLVPFIAMQFTEEVNWNLSDFIIMGFLLIGIGLSCELVLRTVKKTTHRFILCAILLLMLILTWAELAVGIFGTPIAGS